MGSDQDTEQLLERIRRLEAAEAARERSAPTEVIKGAPAADIGGSHQTDIKHSDFSAQTVNTSGRDMYVVQLEERVRFLEGLDRAHRTRRFFFWLSALAFIACLIVVVYSFQLIRDFADTQDTGEGFRRYATAGGGRSTRGRRHSVLDLRAALPAAEDPMSDPDREPGTSISFQNVSAQQINTAGRDMVVSSGAAISAWPEATQQLALVRAQLSAMDLPTPTRRRAHTILDRADAEASSPTADKRRFAKQVETLVEVLQAAGVALTAGAAIVAPLHALVAWLGPLGAAAGHMLRDA